MASAAAVEDRAADGENPAGATTGQVCACGQCGLEMTPAQLAKGARYKNGHRAKAQAAAAAAAAGAGDAAADGPGQDGAGKPGAAEGAANAVASPGSVLAGQAGRTAEAAADAAMLGVLRRMALVQHMTWEYDHAPGVWHVRIEGTEMSPEDQRLAREWMKANASTAP